MGRVAVVGSGLGLPRERVSSVVHAVFLVDAQRWLERCSCARLPVLAYAAVKEVIFAFFEENEALQ